MIVRMHQTCMRVGWQSAGDMSVLVLNTMQINFFHSKLKLDCHLELHTTLSTAQAMWSSGLKAGAASIALNQNIVIPILF